LTRTRGEIRSLRRITLRDVAEQAGVSQMTVSNFLSGRSVPMRKETRERVEAAVRSLNYRPHYFGRALRLAQHLSIGLLIVDFSKAYLADAFTTYVVAGLSNYLSEHGYRLIIQGLRPDQFEEALSIRNVETDGLCIFACGSPRERRRYIDILSSIHQPVVLFQETLDVDRQQFCRIFQDDLNGAMALARHVIAKGARRLLMLKGSVKWASVDARERGIQNAVKSSAVPINLEVIECGDTSLLETRAALEAYLDEASVPDAILASNDQIGIAAMQTLADRGVTVPDHVMVTGFNSFELRLYASPRLTTVHSPAYEMGARGGAEMLARLTGGKFSKTRIKFPVELVLGSST
jgi:LacI family transcriptional regulator